MKREKTILCASWLIAGFLLCVSGSAASACGPNSDCPIGDRHYRIYVPSESRSPEPTGALVFVHGYRGRASDVVQNGALRALADRLGLALVAVASAGDDWSIPGVPSVDFHPDLDEIAYFDAVRHDLIRRLGLNPDRLVVAGFSAGGMMTWHLACHRATDYAAFIPMGGTFWAPIPENCQQPPAQLIHFHGLADTTVPLRGRAIEDAMQGDVRDAIAMYARNGAFRPAEAQRIASFGCEVMRNKRGATLGLCLHAGGHSWDTGFIETGLGMLGFAAGQWPTSP